MHDATCLHGWSPIAAAPVARPRGSRSHAVFHTISVDLAPAAPEADEMRETLLYLAQWDRLVVHVVEP